MWRNNQNASMTKCSILSAQLIRRAKCATKARLHSTGGVKWAGEWVRGSAECWKLAMNWSSISNLLLEYFHMGIIISKYQLTVCNLKSKKYLLTSLWGYWEKVLPLKLQGLLVKCSSVCHCFEMFTDIKWKWEQREFPSAPVVRTQRSHREGLGLIPGGGSHKPHGAAKKKKISG